MSRSNNVRGPTSALTEFLRESGINASSVATRAGARRRQTEQHEIPQVEPAENEQVPEEQQAEHATPNRSRRRRNTGYESDELDDPPTPAKKQKTSKASEKKTAPSKAKAKKSKKAPDEDEDTDEYTALSRSLWSNQGASSSKPPVGNFDSCAECGKQYTVTKYTMAANPGPGYLCHSCAKAAGNNPFKKPVVSKKRKPVMERRNVTHFEECLFPSLAALCIQIVSRHLGDIEAFGDIGALSMQAISKAISKNRSLSAENATLFYGAENTTLTLYDATKLHPDAFITLAYLNPNLTTLRLDFCGLLSDAVLSSWSSSLPNLTSLQLLGPFLVRPTGWIKFFRSHPQLECFHITQSPRFDLDCLNALIDTSGKTLSKLGLLEIGLLSDQFLEAIQRLAGVLSFLDISEPSESCSDDAVIELLTKIGPTLTYLDISGHRTLTDKVLLDGLQPHVQHMASLAVKHLVELTNDGVAAFFSGWTENPALLSLDMSRIPELNNEALLAILKHSGRTLQELNINGWRLVGNDTLEQIGEQARELRVVDMGFCRGVDDFTVKGLIERNTGFLQEVKVWGCNRVEGKWSLNRNKHKNLRIYGVESLD